MKCIVIAPVLALLCVASACDKKEEPTRPDLQAAPVKAEPKAPPTEPALSAVEGRVFFISPKDGAQVPEQFEVAFGVTGKQVRPAGATEREPAFGHHHLLIDSGPLDDMVVVPKDETNLHYGDGATEATLKLAPGRHRLTMQFGDGAHRSYGPQWAETITVEVVAGDGEGEPPDPNAPR